MTTRPDPVSDRPRNEYPAPLPVQLSTWRGRIFTEPSGRMVPQGTLESRVRQFAACYGVTDFDGLPERERWQWLAIFEGLVA